MARARRSVIHRLLTMDMDISGNRHRATARGRSSRRMNSRRWWGSWMAGMPPWWVGKRARETKLKRKRR
jgi:hypothetical protein